MVILEQEQTLGIILLYIFSQNYISHDLQMDLCKLRLKAVK